MPVRTALCAAILAGATLPALAAPEHYTLDPQHTYPSLEMPHMGISVWRGKFDKSAGSVTLDRVAKTGSVEVQVETASIDFGLASMKDFAVKPDWLNTAKYPQMSYKGAIRFEGDTPAAIDGELTLRGITHPLKLKLNSFNCIVHPMLKKQVCGADAEGDLDRADYGMTQYADNGAGRIHLRIQVEGIKD